MDRVFSNTNQRRDFLRWELEELGKNADVYIAVAFFTDNRFIESLIDNGCTVRLIVRLGFPTSARSLNKVFHLKNVYIRYYTAREFHPKLYIFGNRAAFVGSSNLTDPGLISNQELNVSIDPEDPIFDELEEIFSEYWEEAKPLTQEVLDKYSQITSEMEQISFRLEREIYKDLGRVVFPNITRPGEEEEPRSHELRTSLLKRYQLFLGEFENLRRIYESVGRRKISESMLPLRIEIDQFLNWVREKKGYGDLYRSAPRRRGKELEDFVILNISEFLESDYQLDYLAHHLYPTIRSNLASETTIDAWTREQAVETALVVNAFSTRARFYGGQTIMVERFIEDNGLERIKHTHKYLLFGEDEFTERIANCVLDPKYRLKHFGKSCVQETYGWANDSGIPLCNERTFMSMQWLGFGEM
jgi:HKD family nuclease